MDCLIFAAVSKAMAEGPPEAVFYEHEDGYQYENEEEDDYLGPEEHRLLRRRRQRRRRSQRERRMRRLTASGVRPGQVREMEEAVRRSERILAHPLPPPPEAVAKVDVIGVVSLVSGALVAGWIGWVLLLVGALFLMLSADMIILQDDERRCGEDTQADAEKQLADVRAVLERTGNADLLPLQDWLL